jgi:DNA-binding HxlR family transcriptional regulator
MAIPRPGKPVRGSQSGAPIMAAFDLLGRRWAMGIVWNLNQGPATFRALQSLCETISPSILNSRLKDLREAGLVTRGSEGYQLTDLGKELFSLLKPFGEWSIKWARQVSDEGKEHWDAYLERMKTRSG